VEEALDLGELHDLVEAAVDVPARHAHHGAAQVDVLTAGKRGVETGSDLEQAADAAPERAAAPGRLGQVTEDLEEGALAGPVAPDHAQHLPGLDLEADLAQGPEHLRLARRPVPDPGQRGQRSAGDR